MISLIYKKKKTLIIILSMGYNFIKLVSNIPYTNRNIYF